MKNYKLVIGRKNVAQLDRSKLNVVPARFHPYLIDLNPVIASSKSLSTINGRDKEINRIYNCLLSGLKSKVVLLGEHGVGKTAIIQKLIYNVVVRKQCPKELKNSHFLYLDVDLLVNEIATQKSTKRLEKIINFILSHSGIVIYIDNIHFVECSPIMSYYFSLLVKYPNVKIIGATTEEEYYEYFQVDTKTRAHLESIYINEPKHREISPMIKYVVKGLVSKYNVNISPRLINYVVNVSDAFITELCNPAITLEIIEKAMIVAKRKHRKEVTKEDINTNFNFNYDMYKKMSVDDKKSTAYHEAGHFLVNYLSENISNLKTSAITIVPAEDYLGITTFDFEYEKQINLSKDYFVDNIAVALAGRVAENLLIGENSSDKYTSGASQDLMDATETARRIITEYGMIDDFGKNMTYFPRGDISDLFLLSEDIKNKIDKETSKLVQEAYTRAEEMLKDNFVLLDRIANALLSNDVLDEIDLQQICHDEADKKMKRERKEFRTNNNNNKI